MSTNRISGPTSPDPERNQTSKANREEKQRVEKVREVDPDEQAKNRPNKFRMMMDDTDDNGIVPPRNPSPFEPSFYQSEADTTAMPAADQGAIPGPSSSPPPNVNLGGPSMAIDGDDLPQSDTFWNDVGLPDQPKEAPPFQQNAQGKPEEKPAKGKAKAEHSPFGPPGKVAKDASKRSESERDEKLNPSGRYWTPEQPIEGGKVSSPSKKGDEPTKKSRASTVRQEDPDLISPQGYREAETSASSGGKEHKKNDKDKTIDVVNPSSQTLPPDIQPYAMAATTVATRYLSPDILPLFFQMVGSIMIMTSGGGISRTEVTLNAPGFANSKFYGSTIEIIKYSTAPDSLNIRLTGSNEAVTKFNENIPSLMAAFQGGKFNFRIGRLEASYSGDRPLVRRKGKAKDTDSDSTGEQ